MKILKKIQSRLFPSQVELMARQWVRDGGDDRFRFDYMLDQHSIVVDVGGYKGQWASDIYGRFNCRIHIFEPVQQYVDQINARFSQNKKIIVYPFALGGRERKLEISISGPTSSVYLNSEKKEIISVVDVASWFRQAGISNIDVMKINIEGGEYELLDRMIESGIIEHIQEIQIQFHKINSGSKNHMYSIQKQLSRTHKLSYSYEWIWENWTRLKRI